MAVTVSQTYETVRLADVCPHPDNPRQGDVGAIHESIVSNGFYGALVVQRSTGRILAGNHRFLAAREAGLTELPAIVLDVDDDAASRILLVDNRSNDLASYDEASLAALLLTFDDLSGTGYTLEDLEALQHGIDAPLSLDGDEEQPADRDLVGTSYDRFDQERIIAAAIAHYRRHGFPYRSVSTAFGMQQINRLASMPSDKLHKTPVGYAIADTYHRHRYSVPCNDLKPPTASFADDHRMTRLFRMMLEEGVPITDESVLSRVAWVSGTQAAANFRPGFALLLYRRFAPAGGTVLDTSTGFGGRLVGFLASAAGRYIGIDPNVVTHDGNTMLAADYGATDRVELINAPAEDVPHELVAGRCDFAFTSPPYFAKERYAADDSQSWVRYKTGDAWREGFLEPMLALQHAALKPDTTAIVNIADVELRGVRYPLVDWTCEAARHVGFDVVEIEQFPLSRIPGRGDKSPGFEPVIVLHRS